MLEWKWIGIVLCLSQAGVFSGLNLAFFSVSRLRLLAEVDQGNPHAERVLRLREDANFLLASILWGNTSVNVLLALLSEAVMPAVGAFVFSTVGITLFGEILPQAYFSRQALRIASLFTPLIRFYSVLLYPVARPTALLLDRWIGREGIWYFRERDLEAILSRHVREQATDIGAAEGRGALNFLRLDDLPVASEGSPLDPDSVLPIATGPAGAPRFPAPDSPEGRRLVQRLDATRRKWIVFVDAGDRPVAVLDADEYLREYHARRVPESMEPFCFRPIVTGDPQTRLDSLLSRFVVEHTTPEDRILDREVILYWGPTERRIITGPDILGRLLHGIARRQPQGSR